MIFFQQNSIQRRENLECTILSFNKNKKRIFCWKINFYRIVFPYKLSLILKKMLHYIETILFQFTNKKRNKWIKRINGVNKIKSYQTWFVKHFLVWHKILYSLQIISANVSRNKKQLKESRNKLYLLKKFI